MRTLVFSLLALLLVCTAPIVANNAITAWKEVRIAEAAVVLEAHKCGRFK